jgi:hypothetical protein
MKSNSENLNLSKNETIDRALAVAKEQLAHFLEQMVKHHPYRYAYLDLKNIFEVNFDKIKRLLADIDNLDDEKYISVLEAFQYFGEQLSIYAKAKSGNEKNDQLLKLCKIAADHFNINIPGKYILDLKTENL